MLKMASDALQGIGDIDLCPSVSAWWLDLQRSVDRRISHIEYCLLQLSAAGEVAVDEITRMVMFVFRDQRVGRRMHHRRRCPWGGRYERRRRARR